MKKFFELYDDLTGETLSYHSTLNGALEAMAEAVKKVTPALCRDYEDDDKIEFKLSYQVMSHNLKD